MKRSCDSDTRSAYLEQIETGRKSVPEAAKELGVTENTFYRWQTWMRDDPEHGFPRHARKSPRHPEHEWY